MAGIKIICADIERNTWLEKHASYYPITLDLDPLNPNRDYGYFLQQLRTELDVALEAIGERSISCVIQCAGLYWAGPFIALKDDIRRRLFGVNLLGHIDVLHTVMKINEAHGAHNDETLTHIDVGSFQGLQARSGRSVYATSKAAGIDFAAALHAGHDVARSIYFAAGPVDTYMLHHNHWVTKAKGPEILLDQQKDGDRNRYRSIFIDCSKESFQDLLKEHGIDTPELDDTFASYMDYRAEAKREWLGVLSAEECAQLLLGVALDQSGHPSGVYLSLRRGGNPEIRYIRFEDLERLTIARRHWRL